MQRHEGWVALLIFCAAGVAVDGLRGSELVLAAKAKAAEEKSNPTTEEITVVVNEDGSNTTVIKPKPLLTGIPQKDYIYDPNLPHELKGYNLTDYPFFNAVPANITFKCDGLLDGFYASVPHKCQLYHHCLFGTRYDFLCANYTAFDQKTFICHFVSEVDCKNSPNYYKRNEALYKQATTAAPPPTKPTTTPTTTTTTTTEAPPRKGQPGHRRRPYRRRRPVYEYYYDEEGEAYDEEYYDDEEPPPRKANRRQQRPSGGKREDPTTTTTTTTTTPTPAPSTGDGPLTRAPLSVYAPRALPKVKRPVPINEKSKYEYTTKPGTGEPTPTSNPKDGEEDYYDEEEEYDDPQPPPSKRKDQGKSGRRRSQQGERKRPYRHEDEYEDESVEDEERPRRKGHRKDEDHRPRNRGSQGKSKKNHQEEEPIPSERPGYISQPRGGSRKRYQDGRMDRRRPDRRPSKGYDYYDEEEEAGEDDSSRYTDERRRHNGGQNGKPRARPKKPTSTTTTTTTSTTTPPPTTTTTTTTTTPPPPQQYEDEEEYEEYEYEDDIILDKGKDSKSPLPTTPAPHRFSTTAYRTLRPPQSPPTEPAPRRGPHPVTFRPRKPDYKRPPSSEELFSSPVGNPSGFKRVEEENQRSKPDLGRRPLEDERNKAIDPPRKSYPGYSQSEYQGRPSTVEAQQTVVDSRPPQQLPSRHEYSSPQGESKIRDSPGFFIRKPFKPAFTPAKYSEETQQQRRPDGYNVPVTGPSGEEDLSYRRLQQLDSKPSDYSDLSLRKEEKKRLEYPVAPPQITQGPPLPGGPPSIYRRPFVPTAPEGPPKRTEESQQYRRSKPDPYPSPEASNSRRPFPSTAEDETEKNEDTYKKKPTYVPTGPEAFRRPSGPDSSANYRSRRPAEKDERKSLQELAYPRRTTATQASVTEPGPNYRNPFLNARPVVEEPEYYKKEPALDFTAPGPSGDGSTPRPLSSYDLDEEYDVTLNDALQPSTLHPTVQYSRVKTRGYQSAVTHPSYRSILVPAASQNYYTKTSGANDQVEYETVLLPASRYTQTRYHTKRRASNDQWYW